MEKDEVADILASVGVPPQAISSEGLMIMGAPYGKLEFIQEFLDQFILKHAEVLTKISAIRHPLNKLSILRLCMGLPAANHLLRYLLPDQVSTMCNQIDLQMIGAMRDVMGLELEYQMEDKTIARMNLPIRLGGSGLTKTYFVE